MTKQTGKICPKHPNSNWADPYSDAYWACDVCARKDINPCKCGSPAREFGEAMMCSVSCESESCKEHVWYVGDLLNVREAWNSGLRGEIKETKDVN